MVAGKKRSAVRTKSAASQSGGGELVKLSPGLQAALARFEAEHELPTATQEAARAAVALNPAAVQSNREWTALGDELLRSLDNPESRGWIRLIELLAAAREDPLVKGTPADEFAELMVELLGDNASDRKGGRALKELRALMMSRSPGRTPIHSPEQIAKQYRREVEKLGRDYGAIKQTASRLSISEDAVRDGLKKIRAKSR